MLRIRAIETNRKRFRLREAILRGLEWAFLTELLQWITQEISVHFGLRIVVQVILCLYLAHCPRLSRP
jgi:hypothetical protein